MACEDAEPASDVAKLEDRERFWFKIHSQLASKWLSGQKPPEERAQALGMSDNEVLRIIHVDMSSEGAVIGFSNGTTAVYSASLLHSFLTQAGQTEGKDFEESPGPPIPEENP